VVVKEISTKTATGRKLRKNNFDLNWPGKDKVSKFLSRNELCRLKNNTCLPLYKALINSLITLYSIT
jgi:hypothetical protein